MAKPGANAVVVVGDNKANDNDSHHEDKDKRVMVTIQSRLSEGCSSLCCCLSPLLSLIYEKRQTDAQY